MTIEIIEGRFTGCKAEDLSGVREDANSSLPQRPTGKFPLSVPHTGSLPEQ